MASRNHSIFDELHSDLFGYIPAKSGTSFEKIIAVIEKLLSEESGVRHDVKMKGISDALHQIDVYVSDEKKSIAVEAKDHTLSNASVGIGEIRNFFWGVIRYRRRFWSFFFGDRFCTECKKVCIVSRNAFWEKHRFTSFAPIF